MNSQSNISSFERDHTRFSMVMMLQALKQDKRREIYPCCRSLCCAVSTIICFFSYFHADHGKWSGHVHLVGFAVGAASRGCVMIRALRNFFLRLSIHRYLKRALLFSVLLRQFKAGSLTTVGTVNVTVGC